MLLFMFDQIRRNWTALQNSPTWDDRGVALTCEVSSNPQISSLAWIVDANGTTVSERYFNDKYWSTMTASQLLCKSWRYRHVTMTGNCDIMTGNCDIMTFLFARLLREDRSFKFVDVLSSQSDVKRWIKNFSSPQCGWYVPLTPNNVTYTDEEVERGWTGDIAARCSLQSLLCTGKRRRDHGSRPTFPTREDGNVSEVHRRCRELHRSDHDRSGHPSRWVTCRGQNWTSIEVSDLSRAEINIHRGEWPAEGRTGHPSRWVTCRGQNWTSIEVSDLPRAELNIYRGEWPVYNRLNWTSKHNATAYNLFGPIVHWWRFIHACRHPWTRHETDHIYRHSITSRFAHFTIHHFDLVSRVRLKILDTFQRSGSVTLQVAISVILLFRIC